MRFISVVAAVAAAVGSLFDFGLPQGQHAAMAPPAERAGVAPLESAPAASDLAMAIE